MKAGVFPGWWQVAVSLIVQGVSAASIFIAYSVIAVPIQNAFEPSRMVLMLGITVTSLAGGTLSPALGRVIDRYSVRTLMLVGAASLAAGFLLISYSTSMIQVLAVYAVCMAASSVLLGPLATSALLARWFERRRGLAIGIAASGTAVGGLLIPPLLQGLIDAFEWRIALRIFSVLVLLLSVPVIALLAIDRPEDRNLRPDGDSDTHAVSGTRQQPVLLSATAVVHRTSFWMIAIAMGAIFGCSVGMSSNLMPFLLGKGISAELGALLLSVISAANLCGKLLCAAAADRVDARLLLMSIFLLLSLGVCGYLLAASYTMLAVWSAVIGFSSGGALPLWSFLVARNYGPANVGSVMGLMTFVIMPFTLLSAPLLGWVYDRTGSYDHGLVGLIGLLLSMLLLLALIRIDQPVHTPASTTS
jgi:MFS family permease